jgi:hypothetical protein
MLPERREHKTMSGNKYEANSVDATLARFETKLDSALLALVEQNRRIGSLEVAENKRIGALVAIGAGCSIIGGIVAMIIDAFKK